MTLTFFLNKDILNPIMGIKLQKIIFLLFIFVFTQINAISHEISHISDFSEDSNHEQHESNELCDECHATNGYKNLYHSNKIEFNTSNVSSYYSIELDSSVSLKKLFHPQLSQGPPALS